MSSTNVRIMSSVVVSHTCRGSSFVLRERTFATCYTRGLYSISVPFLYIPVDDSTTMEQPLGNRLARITVLLGRSKGAYPVSPGRTTFEMRA